jgi:hypothetical protein
VPLPRWGLSVPVCHLTRVGFEASQLLFSSTLDLGNKSLADHDSSAPRAECTLGDKDLLPRSNVDFIVVSCHCSASSEAGAEVKVGLCGR